MTFGEFVRERRLAKRMTLRAFSEMVGMDPANYSRVERDLAYPPKDHSWLNQWADILSLDSAERLELQRLADLGRGRLPRRALSDPDVMRKLPAIFRAIDEKHLDDIIEAIREEGE